MRLRIVLESDRVMRVPIDHHDLMRGVVYRWLSASDAEFARSVHDEGFGDGSRKLKLFTFSLLRAPRSLRRLEPSRDTLAISPGHIAARAANTPGTSGRKVSRRFLNRAEGEASKQRWT